MTRFIKIFTILTGLTFMTACGASGVLDDARDLIDQARAALAQQLVTDRFLDKRIVDERFAALSETEQTPERKAQIEAEVAALVGTERAEAREAVADDVKNLTGDELAEFNAAFAREVQYLGAVAGLNEEQQEARLITCRGTPDAAGCAGVLTNFCYETPFHAACDVNPDATRRTEYIAECGVGTNVGCIEDAGAVCTGGSNITGCAAFVTRVCDANPTYTACDGNADYFLAQDDACWIQGIDGRTRTDRCQQIVDTNRLQANAEPSCRANYIAGSNENGKNPRCFNAVTAVCNLNPFDSFCRHNTNFLNDRPAYIEACRNEVPNARFCDHAKPFVCDTNPFDDLCSLDYTANDYADERQTAISDCQTNFVAGDRCAGAAVEFCTDGSSITGCPALVTQVCDDNPLYDFCDNADYFVARDNACWIQGRDGGTRTTECQQIVDTNRLQVNAEPACRANFVRRSPENGGNTRCFNAVTAVCNLNPFDSFCQYNDNYLLARPGRIEACRDEVANAPFCAEAKAFVCNDNPFDTLCSLTYTSSIYPTNNDYATERNTAINDCQTTFVAGKVCAGAAVEFCTGKTATDVTDLFSSLCLTHSATDTVRQPLCVGDRLPNTPISARCTETARRICDATPLDPLCDGVEGYFSAQLDACVLDSTNPSCLVGSPTQFAALEPIAACLATPFDAACLNTATPQGMLFAPRAEAAQEAYCEGGATTKIATPDHVNCTNIGSLPDYPSLANEYEFVTVPLINTAGRLVMIPALDENDMPILDENQMPTMKAGTRQAVLGGFLKTGVYGTGLGSYAGVQGSGGNPGTFTDENNNGNFDRGNPAGGAWVNFPATDAENVPAGHPTTYGIDPNLFTPAPAGTTPNGNGFVETQRIYEFTSPVDSKDGFIFFIAQIEDESGSVGTNRSSYGGILSTSNFGAPLAAPVNQEPTSAIWAGQFTAHLGNLRLNAEPTDFYVDFTAGTFNIHNSTENADPKTGSVKAAVGNGSLPGESNYYEASTFVYTVDGVFGAGIADLNNPGRMLNAGELGGKVRLVNTTYALEDQDSTYVEGVSVLLPTISIDVNMPLTGLIGVEGAVGVFLDPNPRDSAIVGGFTAAPMPTN